MVLDSYNSLRESHIDMRQGQTTAPGTPCPTTVNGLLMPHLLSLFQQLLMENNLTLMTEVEVTVMIQTFP